MKAPMDNSDIKINKNSQNLHNIQTKNGVRFKKEYKQKVKMLRTITYTISESVFEELRNQVKNRTINPIPPINKK